MWQVNERDRSQHSLQIVQPSRTVRDLRQKKAQSVVETYPPDPPADGVDEVAAELEVAAPPAPAAGLTGSVTSM